MAAEPNDRSPASWDLVLRMLEQIDARIGQLVSQEVHKQSQEANAQRFRDQAEDLTEWKAESRGAHVALDAKIEAAKANLDAKIAAERQRTETLERQAREGRSRTLLAIGTSILGAVLSIGGALVVYVVTSGGA